MTRPEIKFKKQQDWPYPEHGGALHEASRIAGLSPEEIIDFSASINPMGPPENALSVLDHSKALLKNYPDPNCRETRKSLSQYLNVKADSLLIGNGSTELIYLLPHLINEDEEILLGVPGFSEYERAFNSRNVPVHKFQLNPDQEFKVEPEKLLFELQKMKNPGGLVLGHPNSPSGNLWDMDSLKTLLNFCKKRNLFLIIDETFIEFSGEKYSLLKQVESNKHLIIIRSITKFFALPGLRLGYAVLQPEWLKKLSEKQVPWSVNAMAQKVASVLFEDEKFLADSRNLIKQENEFLFENLNTIPSIKVFPSDTNFLLFRVEQGDTGEAKRLYKNLLMKGILVRNCGNFDGLNHIFFRVAVKNRSENRLLINELKVFFNGSKS